MVNVVLPKRSILSFTQKGLAWHDLEGQTAIGRGNFVFVCLFFGLNKATGGGGGGLLR